MYTKSFESVPFYFWLFMIKKNNNTEILKKLIAKASSCETAMVLVSNSEYNEETKYTSYEMIMATGVEKSVSLQKNSNFFEALRIFSNENNDWIFGHLGYDLKNHIEKLTSDNRDNIKFPEGFFFVPKNIILIQNGKQEKFILEHWKT